MTNADESGRPRAGSLDDTDPSMGPLTGSGAPDTAAAGNPQDGRVGGDAENTIRTPTHLGSAREMAEVGGADGNPGDTTRTPSHLGPITKASQADEGQREGGDRNLGPSPETASDPAPKPAPKARRRSVIRDIVEWVLIVAVAVGLALVVRTYVVEPYEIPTESMIDTIEVGDRILGEKITYRNRDPEAGDIVTFIDPEDPDTTLIKRIIATPGQTVSIEDGAVYVDGERLDEPYTLGKPTGPLARHASILDGDIEYPYTLGEDEYWVMGDNRTNSLDSRYFGPIKRDAITSKAWLTFWPFNDVSVF